jgi:hypothetical protein
MNGGTARLNVVLDTTHGSADSPRPKRPCEAKRSKAIGYYFGGRQPVISTTPGVVTGTVAHCDSAGNMGMTISFARHQFPPAIIQHAVWLYVRFTLSSRDVEELLAERGPDLSYETARRWVSKFGPLFAREPRRQRPRPTSRWRLDEMARFRALGSGSEIGRRISHQQVRRRERKMQRFKSPGSAQRFRVRSCRNTFNVPRHLTSRHTLRLLRDESSRTWSAASAA